MTPYRISTYIGGLILCLLAGAFTATASSIHEDKGLEIQDVEKAHPASNLPQILSQSDITLYQKIFNLQEKGDIASAEKLVKKLGNRILVGHVLSQKYLHPTAWRSSYTELRNWLEIYNDHPAASRIKWLADKRRPKGAKYPKPPKKGYLNGVGQSRPQSYRAYIPQSYAGRASPRKTAEIARQIRRSIRRGHPSGALEYLNKKSSLR